MHIAVCDDNVADRKQTERLLSRESAKRTPTTGNLYIDSFGNEESLLAAPMKYDLFFLDMTASPANGAELATMLRSKGVTAPIVLLISSIDYRKESVPENVEFLDKPIKTAELSALLDVKVEECKDKEPTIEIRDRENAHYLLAKQFIHATTTPSGVVVTCTDGLVIHPVGDINDLCGSLAGFHSFVLIGRKTVINLEHVKEIKKRTVLLSDGTSYTLSILEKNSFINALRTFHG
jgi:DNA-binding LytR/AlgR family response regulator